MKNRKLTTGFYRPTESYKSIPEHIAVMFEDDQTLVAVCGASNDDPENLAESIEYSRKFAAVNGLLDALTDLCKTEDCGNCEGSGNEIGTEDACRVCGGYGFNPNGDIREAITQARLIIESIGEK